MYKIALTFLGILISVNFIRSGGTESIIAGTSAGISTAFVLVVDQQRIKSIYFQVTFAIIVVFSLVPTFLKGFSLYWGIPFYLILLDGFVLLDMHRISDEIQGLSNKKYKLKAV